VSRFGGWSPATIVTSSAAATPISTDFSIALRAKISFATMSVVEGVLLDRPEPTPMFLPLSSIPCPDKQ